MYNGVPGHWSAWIVDSDGNRGQWGIIPSKYKVCHKIVYVVSCENIKIVQFTNVTRKILRHFTMFRLKKSYCSNVA